MSVVVDGDHDADQRPHGGHDSPSAEGQDVARLAAELDECKSRGLHLLTRVRNLEAELAQAGEQMRVYLTRINAYEAELARLADLDQSK